MLKSSLNFFKSTYCELMEKYCNIIDQIPADYFNSIGGFEAGTFLKLKIMRQKFKAKTKLLTTTLEKLENKQNFNIDDMETEDEMEKKPEKTIEKSSTIKPLEKLETKSVNMDDVETEDEMERQQPQRPTKLEVKPQKPFIRLTPEPDFDIDDMEEEERQMKAEQKQMNMKQNIMNSNYCNGAPEDEDDLVELKPQTITASTNLKDNNKKTTELTRFREELVHDLCEEDDVGLEDAEETYLKETICLDDYDDDNNYDYGSNSKSVDVTETNDNDEDDCELDDLLNDIKEQDNELKGRRSMFDGYAYGDFEEEKKPIKEQPAAQRITFPVEANQRVKTPELDEDGFPVSYWRLQIC